MFDFKKIVGEYFGFTKEIQELNTKYEALLLAADTKLIALQERIKEILASNETNKAKFLELQKAIDVINKEREFELMITNKIPKTERYYSRYETDGEYSVDVRNFFMINDNRVPIVKGATNDDKALLSLNWVKTNITYVPDASTATYKKDEYWAYAYQTLKHKMGDCEDGAILIANIMVKSGIPWYRVRVCAGSVNGGGHAYCVYCRETDNEWVVLDWCYWPNDLPIKDRPTHKQERNYMDSSKNYYVWFSWDLKNIYAKETLSTEAAKIFKEQKKNIFELFNGW